MTKVIALAGKGGTGKTTVAALLIRALEHLAHGPMLAIDADPATNLHMALGVPMPQTVGDIREDMASGLQRGTLDRSMSRVDFLDREVRMAMEEGTKVDLIAMGRPEGSGCYCAFNNMLRGILDRIARNYEFVVIDNEAGMEHISRRTTRDVDVLLLVTDPTVRGVRTAGEMARMAGEVEVNVDRVLLVVNRVQGELPPRIKEEIDALGLQIAAVIPADESINRLDAEGEPLVDLRADSPVHPAIETVLGCILDSQPA